MSQYNNIVITPNIGVSSSPNIEFSGVGNTSIKLEYYNSNNSSLAIISEDEILFSVSNTDEENPDLIYAINDDDGTIALSVSNSGITTIRELQVPFIDYLATGAASTTKITTKHYGTDGGYLAFESGISTSHIFSVGSQSGENGEVYVIGNDNALPLLTVYETGETALISVSIASTVSAATTQKMQISAVSRDNGLLEIANYGGNQLFSASNNQTEDAFAVYRYANYDNLSIVSFNNRKLFNVNPLGIVTTYGALRVGTSNTIANSSVFNQFYGNVNIRAPFSTTTEYVSIVPKFNDRGALSFEAPIGAAQTDRGTQVFSISNNFTNSIFRVNDLNRAPLLEVNATGVGIGTTNPQAKLEVHGTTRVTSTGSTAGEQIDIRHYRNIAPQTQNYTGVGLTNNRGAISFDSATGISTNGITFFPASLFAITNDPTGNIFSVAGYGGYFSGSGVPAIDVTQIGRVGIGTTNPVADFEIRSNSYVTGDFQIQNKIIFSKQLNPGITSYVSAVPYTPSLGSNIPTRGSVAFEGAIETSTSNDGGQLVTILNDNSTLFGVSRILGITSTNPPPLGTRLIEPVLDISSSGNIGIGATNISNKVQINSINELVPSVVSSASSIGISTTIIGINTSGIAVGLEIQSFTGVIAAGTTVVSIGNTQIGIGRTTLNNFIRTNTVLTFGSRGNNDRVVAITSTGFVGLGITNPTVRLDVAGNVRISGVSTVGLGSTSSPTVNSTMSFELTNDTTLTVRVRGTDGTVRTGTISLS